MRFTRAYVEGMHRFKTDKAATLAVLEKYTKQKTTPAIERVYQVYATKYFKPAPEATPAAIQTTRRNLRHSPAAAGHRHAAVRRVAIYPRTGFHRFRRRPL
jgi:hypothetical protein